MRRRLAGTAALAALIACSHGNGDPTSTEDTNEIIHGKLDTSAHDAVVLVIAPGDTAGYISRCTGTVVAPNLVLTARHCVSKTDLSSICNADGSAQRGGGVYSDKKASDLRIYTGLTAAADVGTLPKTARAGVSDTSARGKKIIVEDTSTYCDHDVAFLVLDRDLDVAVAPMRLAGGPREGELLTAVGWGYAETGVLATERMFRTDIPVRAVGPRVLNAGGAGLGASEFLVGEAICQGDSGGPSFSASGALVGVVSRGGNGTSSTSNAAAGCIGTRTVNTYTHLAEKLDLVTSAFEAAGHAPLLEAPIADAGRDASSLEISDAGTDAAPIAVPVVVEQPDAAASSAPQAPVATSSNGGCSATPGAGTSNAGLLGLALLLVRRRRRT